LQLKPQPKPTPPQVAEPLAGAGQTLPQEPQLLVVVASTQAPLQGIPPSGQLQ